MVQDQSRANAAPTPVKQMLSPRSSFPSRQQGPMRGSADADAGASIVVPMMNHTPRISPRNPSPPMHAQSSNAPVSPRLSAHAQRQQPAQSRLGPRQQPTQVR